MEYRVVFSPEAEAQLVAIYNHIAAAASPSIAERFTGSIVDYCESFALFPQRGTERNDLQPGLRTIGFRYRVTIAFTVEAPFVNIVGVFYGGQNYEAVLSDDTEAS